MNREAAEKRGRGAETLFAVPMLSVPPSSWVDMVTATEPVLLVSLGVNVSR